MAAAMDITGISYFLPVISFLVIFVISFAVMSKIKFPENKFLQALVAFLIATLFISVGGARSYIENVTPWFAVILICLFLMLLVIGLAGKDLEKWGGVFGKIFVVILFVVFVIAALFVFSSYIAPYLPWTAAYGSTKASSTLGDWLYSSHIGGSILLLIISALVAWLLVKSK